MVAMRPAPKLIVVIVKLAVFEGRAALAALFSDDVDNDRVGERAP